MDSGSSIYVQSIILSVSAIVIFFAGYFLRWIFAHKQLKESQQKAKSLIDLAQKEAETLRKEVQLQGKDFAIKLREEFEKETRDKTEKMAQAEKRIVQKEENIERRLDLLDKKEKDINGRLALLHENEEKVQKQSQELNVLVEEEKKRLQTISSMTEEDAKKLLLSRLEEDLVHEKATRIRKAEEEIREVSDKKAQYVLAQAIQRCASEHTASSTVTMVILPNDEMKGRIIGREGRNIRALEAAAGVDIIIDDTP
ncbi:MAG TPA: Rnase Y domain-containing protein, partial [Candidatus Omnitrophota bacterium]|nr:Rnase Y domain-containing protein [Candidatus Omnitrophota bacterium]